MPLYESTFIARQDLSKQDVTRLVEGVTSVITQQGGNVVRVEQWGLRNLAYKINKNRKGHYVMLMLDAPAEAVKEMERTLRINEEVMRLLTVRVESYSEEPTAMMNMRSGREDNYESQDGYGAERGERGERSERPQVVAPAPNETDAA